MTTPRGKYATSLLDAALAYDGLGYAVIPLRGDLDADQPKAPAIPWKPYQDRRATQPELTNWFMEEGFLGIGIVTGRVSSLIVLDLDRPNLLFNLKSRHPHLAETRTIQTRRGFHLYYQLPPRMPVPSRKGEGVDLLSDGCYIVAPPTIINGTPYRLARPGSPLRLSLEDLHRIEIWITDIHAQPPPSFTFQSFAASLQQVQETPVLKQAIILPDTVPAFSPSLNSGRAANVVSERGREVEVLALYHSLAPMHGRNVALFQASLLARDTGWNIDDAVQLLASVHVSHLGRAGQPPESPAARLREARATIHSAFSRPPHKRAGYEKCKPLHLPNTVREKLLQMKQTATLRVLESLFQKGIEPGAALSQPQIVQLLAGVVGEWSIRLALQAVAPDGETIFERRNPSPKPPTPANAATDNKTGTTKKCFFGGAEKPPGSLKHRPPVMVLVPSITEICHKLGVKPSGGDLLMLDDLTSAKKTRQAIHRELIKRRPGMYPRRWLSNRLGVCVETLDTYNRDIPIHIKHMFLETHIDWSNLKRVPETAVTQRAFLEDDRRKRYPALRQIAARLLREGRGVILKYQDANYYWYGDALPDLSIHLGVHPRHEEMEMREQQSKKYVTQWLKQHPPQPSPRPSPTPARSVVPVEPRSLKAASPPESPARPPRPRSYHRPQPDTGHESAAQRLYTHMNSLITDPTHGLSLSTARRLIDLYGTQNVDQAAAILTKRRNIHNPTGFLVTFLRSSSKRR